MNAVKAPLRAYKPQKVQVEHRTPGAYRLRRDRRLVWLQRACLWVLARLGCHYIQQRIGYETVTIKFDDIADLITQQAMAIRAMTGKLPKCVILGAEQADALDLWTVGQEAFYMPPGRFRGMLIIVAPYFDGVICLEELYVERIMDPGGYR